MSYFKIALNADLDGDYRAAIDNYLLSIKNNELEIDAYLNLIPVLIDICFDYGLESYLVINKIYSESELVKLISYIDSLIEETINKFNSDEAKFWKYYREHFYQDYNREATLEFVKNSDNLIPYFHLYCNDLCNENVIYIYKNQVIALKLQLNQLKTMKNLRILSLIESAEENNQQFFGSSN